MVRRATFVTLFGALALGLSAACGSDAPAASTAGGAASATPYLPTPAAAPPRVETAGTEPLASTASIPAERLPTVEFISNGGVVGRLPLEVLPVGEFSIGLSGRTSLGERGMLFDYGKPGQEGPFWMKGTYIDLDIAFIDDAQRIVSIRTMRAESLEYTYSAAPYRSAIEVPAGWYAAHGVKDGDLVRYVPAGLPPTP